MGEIRVLFWPISIFSSISVGLVFQYGIGLAIGLYKSSRGGGAFFFLY